VPYLDEERAELQAIEDFKARTRPAEMRGAHERVPEMKLPARGWALVDLDGRIWISRSTRAENVAPRIGAVCPAARG
jgi:hypothetical protein